MVRNLHLAVSGRSILARRRQPGNTRPDLTGFVNKSACHAEQLSIFYRNEFHCKIKRNGRRLIDRIPTIAVLRMRAP
jgi:hypothetical protein